MTDDARKAAIAAILADCGESPTTFAAAQAAWRLGFTIAGPDGIGSATLNAALRQALGSAQEIHLSEKPSLKLVTG